MAAHAAATGSPSQKIPENPETPRPRKDPRRLRRRAARRAATTRASMVLGAIPTPRLLRRDARGQGLSARAFLLVRSSVAGPARPAIAGFASQRVGLRSTS